MDKIVMTRRPAKIARSKSISLGKLTYLARLRKKIIARAETPEALEEKLSSLKEKKKSNSKANGTKKSASKQGKSVAKPKAKEESS